MPDHSLSGSKASSKLSTDFWKLCLGRAISSLGGSFTIFTLPLLIFRLTNSAIPLSLIDVVMFLVPSSFSFSALGCAERYLPEVKSPPPEKEV